MRHLIIPLLAAASVLNTAPARADLGDQLKKLIPNENVQNDEYGISVAIRGTTAIVGAQGDDDNGSNSGAAYLFDTISGKQLFKLLPTDGGLHDLFGSSVAICESIAVIGAPGDDYNGTNSGSAYIFDTATGQQIAKLLPNDGEEWDLFGLSVAIGGSPGNEIVIIGAQWDDDNGELSGSAYLFKAKTGLQLDKLLPDDGMAGDGFGKSVAISNTTAIVGAFRDDNQNGIRAGSVYLFDTNTGLQIMKLLPSDGAAVDQFGYAVAVSETTAIISANKDDDSGYNAGSAYLFDITTGQQFAKLLANDGAGNDAFGMSVSIYGTRVIVGAHFDGDNGPLSGSAYIFDISDPTNPTQLVKLLPDDGGVEEVFGITVGISGPPGAEVAIVGNQPSFVTGSAYLFDAAGFPVKCLWDLDESGSVGTGDLLELFAQWGTDGPADFDESGAVGTNDLLILFANWGPCK